MRKCEGGRHALAMADADFITEPETRGKWTSVDCSQAIACECVTELMKKMTDDARKAVKVHVLKERQRIATQVDESLHGWLNGFSAWLDEPDRNWMTTVAPSAPVAMARILPVKEFEIALRASLDRLSNAHYEIHGLSASPERGDLFKVDIMIVSYFSHEVRSPVGNPDLFGRLQEAGFVVASHGDIARSGDGPLSMIHDIELMFVRPVHEAWLAAQGELPIVRKGSLWPMPEFPDSIETDLFAGKKTKGDSDE